MYISRLEWDNYRIEHVALHSVEPHEVEEACDDPLHRTHREGRTHYRLYGQTAAVRYLFVVIEHIQGSVYKPVTARDMTSGEKRNFRKLQK